MHVIKIPHYIFCLDVKCLVYSLHKAVVDQEGVFFRQNDFIFMQNFQKTHEKLIIM